MKFLKVVLASAIGYILAAVLLVGLFMAMMVGIVSSAKPEVKIPSNAVLNMKLNYQLKDKVQDQGPLAALSALDPNVQMPVGLNDILHTIDHAKNDSKIEGIILDLTTVQAGYAKLTEVRNKLEEFKESGKFIYAYADYYYFPTYYLASVADSIFINPEGQMAFTGMVAEVAFFANTLEKLGVEMQVVRAGKFKGAVEPYTRTSLSEENRLQIETYINSVFDQTLEKISSSRGITVDTLRKHADELKIKSIEDFLNNNYIDAAVYKDEFYAAMKTRMGVETTSKVPLVTPIKYAKKIGSRGDGKDRIAIVYADGDIVGGKGDGSQIAAEDVVATLKKVREDKRIKAVVFRINSRGGSSLASDIIWREAKLLAETKPLIASMGDVAASGGYYIALPANKIVAEPTSITGSIGVFGLIPNAKVLLNDKLGLNFEYVGTGAHSDVGRIDRDMTSDEREYIEQLIDRIYDTFLSRVSEGRGMTKDEAHEIAQGRVWTGIMAQEVGLIDELGGLEKAIEVAANEAGIESYKIKEYPKVKDPITIFVDKMQGNSSMEAQLNTFAKSTTLGPYVKYISDFEKWGSKQTIQAMMPFDIRVKNYFLQ
jgi:protease-4